MEDAKVAAYEELSKEELLNLKTDLEAQFAEVKAKGLKLDMSRGKPSTEQLNLSMEMMDVLKSDSGSAKTDDFIVRVYVFVYVALNFSRIWTVVKAVIFFICDVFLSVNC